MGALLDAVARALPLFIVDPARPGADLITTIDREIEYAVERILERALAETNAVSGTVVVLDATTGEVLAMATAPSFDPNAFSEASPTTFRNRAVADVYENHVRRSFRAKDVRGRANRFQWPLLAACLFWILDLCVSDKRR